MQPNSSACCETGCCSGLDDQTATNSGLWWASQIPLRAVTTIQPRRKNHPTCVCTTPTRIRNQQCPPRPTLCCTAHHTGEKDAARLEVRERGQGGVHGLHQLRAAQPLDALRQREHVVAARHQPERKTSQDLKYSSPLHFASKPWFSCFAGGKYPASKWLRTHSLTSNFEEPSSS